MYLKNSVSLNASAKLSLLYSYKTKADDAHRVKDSIYAKLLYEISKGEFNVNNNYSATIILLNEALRINMLDIKASSKQDAALFLSQLAAKYEQLGVFDLSLKYYDTAIQVCKKMQCSADVYIYSRLRQSILLFRMGDYQQSVFKSTDGILYSIQSNNLEYYFYLLVQKAQSLFYMRNFDLALSDVEAVIVKAPLATNKFSIAGALKIKALINEKKGNLEIANLQFKEAISFRKLIQDFGQISDDYTDWGNFYLNTLHDQNRANDYYLQTIKYARLAHDSLRMAKAFINMGEAAYKRKDFSTASSLTIKAMQFLQLQPNKNFLLNPLASQLNSIGTKDPVFVLMTNKAAMLDAMYHQTKETKYLQASIQTALLTDSVITQTRHEQSGEQSKLYWRDKTRDLYTLAIEACYAANDAAHAFYFMEKSRAVLLNDKLNELGASLTLTPAEIKTEQDFKIAIAIEQQKLNGMAANSTSYAEQQIKLIKVRDDFDHYIKSLENKNPVYYQYKYADKVPLLADLQRHLALTKSCFVHYFTNDTIAYVLAITPGSTKLLKLGKNDFSYGQLDGFIKTCADKNAQNTQSSYASWAALSNTLYKTLFEPLHLPQGRVVICGDNFLLPFEALCTDKSGKNFLISRYIFSYAYSATYLLKETPAVKASGDFIGFAPVTFRPGLQVNSLINSAPALSQSSAHYASSLLFTNKDASRNNFMQNIGRYAVANIYSHASGNTAEEEPMLYMQDSLIHLSDLQLITQPATSLVVLSACQTNVGKVATGEGIYSLARGFAAAGIPAVSATLWNADEGMIYEVSVQFNEYLAAGMCKDSALQQAKLSFFKHHINSEKSLPYYWANIVLIGNTDALNLSKHTNIDAVVYGVIIVVVLLLLTLAVIRKGWYTKVDRVVMPVYNPATAS